MTDDNGRHKSSSLRGDSTDRPAAKPTFFAEDTCALKDDPSKIVVVDRTWHDVDFDTFSPADYNFISVENVDPKLLRKFKSTGTPPRDYAFVTFIELYYGSSLIHESKLILLDRSLSTGDVVKRDAGNAMSGTVIRTSTECTLRPSFPRTYSNVASSVTPNWGPVLENEVLWQPPHLAPSNLNDLLLTVPAEELGSVEEWQEGTFIIYRGWLGRVVEALQHVTIGLPNGSVVVVEEADEIDHLSGPGSTHGLPVEVFTPGLRVQTKKGNLRRGNWKYGAYDPSIPPRGVVLETSVSGVDVEWLSPNLSAPEESGIPRPPATRELEILESGKVIQYDRGRTPPELSTLGDFPGFVSGSNISTGDCVRFKDLSGAAVKYNPSNVPDAGRSHGHLIRIPRSASLGYDLNVFNVVQTKTTVTVLWQDLSKSQEWSGAFIPYLNVDDHDVWPGEMVISSDLTALGTRTEPENPEQPDPAGDGRAKDGQARRQSIARGSAHDEDVLRLKKVGVVQKVDSVERMAEVRWALNPNLELAGFDKNTLLPGGSMGELAVDSELVSVYELMAKPGLTTRIGDFVLVFEDESDTVAETQTTSPVAVATSIFSNSTNAPRSEPTQLHTLQASAVDNFLSILSVPERDRLARVAGSTSTPALLELISAARAGFGASQRRAVDQALSMFSANWWRNTLNAFDQQQNPPHRREPQDHDGDRIIDWFGEVVELGLDGLVTVRLGALQEACDVRVPIHRIRVISSGDDSDLGSDMMDEGWSDEDISLGSSEEVLEETIEYEGGENMDADGDEDLWATDEEDVGADFDVPMTDAEGNEPLYEDLLSRTAQARESGAHDNTKQDGHHELRKENDSHQLEKFCILESEPPQDHPYINTTSDLSTKQMRRIQKEHKILQSSMPEDIYVRTWESRLDLLRVLIVGPRKTPYELAPFLIDFRFGPTFPAEPPMAFFHSWTNGVGRVNPNLYEDGKICLSLLGTWPATEKNARWSEGQSSMLQVLVSIMGLVLVKEPYYNEAGFDILIGTSESRLNAAQYSERAYVLARGFLKHALQHDIKGFEDVMTWLYHPNVEGGRKLLRDVIDEARETISRSENKAPSAEMTGMDADDDDDKESKRRVSAGALRLLRTNVEALERIVLTSTT